MRNVRASSRLTADMAGKIAIGISSYALLALVAGWFMGIDPLVRHLHSGTAMVPATSISFIAISVALLAALAHIRLLTQILLAAVLVLVGVTVVTQIFGLSGFARLFVIDTTADERMAPVTAIGFALAVVAINRIQAGSAMMVTGVSMFGLSGALGVLLTKLESYTGLVEPRFFAGASLQTAVLFALLFLAMCMVKIRRPRQ